MDGYVAFEILRQAAWRVAKLALIDTSARADLPEQSARWQELIAFAREGRLMEINSVLWPVLVHERHRKDAMRAIIDEMAADVGAEVFIRQ